MQREKRGDRLPLGGKCPQTSKMPFSGPYSRKSDQHRIESESSRRGNGRLLKVAQKETGDWPGGPGAPILYYESSAVFGKMAFVPPGPAEGL